MLIDMNNKYQTRDGRGVRILCVDGPSTQPVIGLVEGESDADQWYPDGRYMSCDNSGWDLIIPPQMIPLGPEDVIKGHSLVKTGEFEESFLMTDCTATSFELRSGGSFQYWPFQHAHKEKWQLSNDLGKTYSAMSKPASPA